MRTRFILALTLASMLGLTAALPASATTACATQRTLSAPMVCC